MKTEEWLRYEKMYRTMKEALGTWRLTFDFEGRCQDLDGAKNVPYQEQPASIDQEPISDGA